MSELSDNPNLKEINAYKKKLNWGDIPTIYHLAASSLGDIDSILTHGFDSAYKQILNKNNWNIEFLNGHKDITGKINVANKPRISLRHVFDEQNYELHCYPLINDERIISAQFNHPDCPFIKWLPETMQMLFRVNSLVPFIVYTFQNGDKADFALMRYANARVEELIELLSQSFEIVDVKGYSIAGFCKELYRNRPHFHLTDMLDKSDDTED
jgi:hypothetical protein